MTTHKEPLFPFAFEEGRARDWLADKLLSLPALEECTAEETEEWRRALELLWETEIRSVLQCRGLNRPLRYGNLRRNDLFRAGGLPAGFLSLAVPFLTG